MEALERSPGVLSPQSPHRKQLHYLTPILLAIHHGTLDDKTELIEFLRTLKPQI